MPSELMRHLVDAGRHAASADNLQPWRFVMEPERLSVELDPVRTGGPAFDTVDHAHRLAIGAAIENLFQAASAAGVALEGEVRDALGPGGAFFECAVDPAATVPPSARSHALFGRHSNRFAFARRPLPAELLAELSGLREGAARVVCVDDRQTIRGLAGLVYDASEARLRWRELHEWLYRSLRLTPEEVARGDGLDVATFDMPPGAGLAFGLLRDFRRMSLANRLGMSRAFAAGEKIPVAKAPALVLVVGGSGAEDTLDAGRLMERAWILLNARRFAVHPYYALAHQMQCHTRGLYPAEFGPVIEKDQAQLRRLLGLDGEVLHMMLRVGEPTRVAPRALRLPLEAVSEVRAP